MTAAMAPAQDLYVGLMSGTSMDGIDGVLARIDAQGRPQRLAHASAPLPQMLRDELHALNSSGPDELHRAALAAVALAHCYADLVTRLLDGAGVRRHEVAALGAHGQTLRHQPSQGYTLQLNAPALLAELTGLGVVADFRSRDVAAGGQGAPLVPAFHARVFASDAPRAVLNLGGIANVTLLTPGSDMPAAGFDTGPANMLMDLWCQQHTGKPYDEDGQWAAQGQVQAGLLRTLIDNEPWFALPAPKSTGRDLFHAAWLAQRLQGIDARPEDVQATLRQLTVETVARALESQPQAVADMLVCGGGAYNKGLMQALAERLGCPVSATDSVGVPAQEVEALAFAWLGWAHLHQVPAGLPSVTGARGARVLGAHYPA